MSNLKNIQDVYSMMGEGKALEAIDKYYADDVQVIEGTGDVRNGRAAQKEACGQWLGNIKEMHGGGIDAFTISEDGNTTSVECWYDNTFADGRRMKLEEVAVQKWKNGKIVKERFYYNAPN